MRSLTTGYVFTPKGDVVDLPAGSTPLDFALPHPQ
ncbi:TGS domain-containing protein [Shigella flexneri]